MAKIFIWLKGRCEISVKFCINFGFCVKKIFKLLPLLYLYNKIILKKFEQTKKGEFWQVIKL